MSSRNGGKRRPGSKAGEAEARLAVNLPAAVHRAVKRRAAERGISIRTFILELLAKGGIGE